MDAKVIRMESWDKISKLRLPVNTSLPLLGDEKITRRQHDIEDRLLCNSALSAVAHGFDRQKAFEWLKSENLVDKLLDPDIVYLTKHVGDYIAFQNSVEAEWALAWCLKMTDDIFLTKPCPDYFVKMLPDLRVMEGSEKYRKKMCLRSKEEMLPYLDFYYCAHWAIREMSLRKLIIKKTIDPVVIIERRKAFEWIFSDDDWYDLSLDT